MSCGAQKCFSGDESHDVTLLIPAAMLGLRPLLSIGSALTLRHALPADKALRFAARQPKI
jgi:hypothetical protein